MTRAIDADGHVLEPPDLWQRYLEARHRDRALRIRTDDDGLEVLEIGGKPSAMSRKGFPGTLGGMGRPVDEVTPTPERFAPPDRRCFLDETVREMYGITAPHR